MNPTGFMVISNSKYYQATQLFVTQSKINEFTPKQYIDFNKNVYSEIFATG